MSLRRGVFERVDAKATGRFRARVHRTLGGRDDVERDYSHYCFSVVTFVRPLKEKKGIVAGRLSGKVARDGAGGARPTCSCVRLGG